jgi:hypothetical protein
VTEAQKQQLNAMLSSGSAGMHAIDWATLIQNALPIILYVIQELQKVLPTPPKPAA